MFNVGEIVGYTNPELSQYEGIIYGGENSFTVEVCWYLPYDPSRRSSSAEWKSSLKILEPAHRDNWKRLRGR